MNFSQTYAEALDKITKNCFKNKKAFVLYKKAEQSVVQLIIADQYTSCFLSEVPDNSFICMPFDKNNKGFAIDLKRTYSNQEILDFALKLPEMDSYPAFHKHDEHVQATEEEFVLLVEKIKKGIQDRRFSKVVASRIFSKRYKGNIISAYLSLCDLYAHSFNYLIYIPGEICWIGATPEILLQVTDAHFHTISLAGTQLKKETATYSWPSKEREEQSIVTKYIETQLQKLIQDNLSISEPYTVEAGNVAHIRTDIRGVLPASTSVKDLIELLHPTPAVCGMPKASSERFILRHESHDRAFYTGYIGIYQSSKEAELYVNLRCASIDNKAIHFYIGCGITTDSVAEKEWIETENKLNTLKTAFRLS